MTKYDMFKGGIIISKAKKLFDVIMYVNNKRYFTAREIAETFDISIRTAHRYLLELSDMGIPIFTEQGKYGGYRVLENRILPPIIFNEEEAIAIYFTFQSLNYHSELPFDINIESVKQKLYTSFPDDSKRMIDQYHKHLRFWNPPRDVIEINMRKIIRSYIENKIIKFTYESYKGSSNRMIVPLGLYSYQGNWYLPSFDIDKKNIRVFRADRIKDIVYTDEKYETEWDVEKYLNHTQIQSEENKVRLYVEFDEKGIIRSKDEHWINENISKVNHNEAFIDMLVNPSELEYLKNFFLRFGKHATIKSPQILKEMMLSELEEMIINLKVK